MTRTIQVIFQISGLWQPASAFRIPTLPRVCTNVAIESGLTFSTGRINIPALMVDYNYTLLRCPRRRRRLGPTHLQL